MPSAQDSDDEDDEDGEDKDEADDRAPPPEGGAEVVSLDKWRK